MIDYLQEQKEAVKYNSDLDDMFFSIEQDGILDVSHSENKRKMLTMFLKRGWDLNLVLSYKDLLEVKKHVKYEQDKTLKSNLQACIRLYESSHNKDLTCFLINYLKRKDPDYLFGTQQYVNLG